jgi:hypothetical protein
VSQSDGHRPACGDPKPRTRAAPARPPPTPRPSAIGLTPPPPPPPPPRPRRLTPPAASGPLPLRTLAAVAAHDKEINAVAVAPNDSLAATASQDRTVRLWALPSLAAGLVLRGHKRGVWAVAFSPVDQARARRRGGRAEHGLAAQAPPSTGPTGQGPSQGALARAAPPRGPPAHAPRAAGASRRAAQLTARPATPPAPAPRQVLLSASGDKTLKLWSLRDGSCLRTFEGHAAGVLRCRFATAGTQALSTGALASAAPRAAAPSRQRRSRPFAAPPLVGAPAPPAAPAAARTRAAPLAPRAHYTARHASPRPHPQSAAGADGLMKLWNARTGECAGTFDAHDDRVWALASGGAHEAVLATGGADARVVIWCARGAPGRAGPRPLFPPARAA